MIKKEIKLCVSFFLAILLVSTPLAFASQLNQTLIYDGNGNLITGDGKYREYNGFNQLIRVREGNSSSGYAIEEYVYHPTEDRILIKKVDFGNTLNFDPDEVIVYVNDNFVRRYDLVGTREINDTFYVKDENGIVAEIVFNGTTKTPIFTQGNKLYYHNDHLGSTSVITNQSGSVVEETFYAPYGEILSGGEVSRFDYEGKEFSSLTEDYDFKFRKYNPEIGIFTQPEQIFPNVYDPQQLNRYAFERRNPYKYTDPDGKWIETAVDIGFITYDISQLSTEEGTGEWINWVSLGADVAFAILPFVTGGVIAIRGGVKGVKALNKAEKANDLFKDRSLLKQNQLKGAIAERDALKELGLSKNTQRFTVKDPKTGSLINTIPDVATSSGRNILDVKNVKYLSYTRQLRAQDTLARKVGEKATIITGALTKISKTVQERFNIIRRTFRR